MKVLVEIDVPEGEHCDSCKQVKSHLWDDAYFCNLFREKLVIQQGEQPKLPACLALPRVLPVPEDDSIVWDKIGDMLPCGHHPDALMTEYNDGEDWCAACHQMPDEVNHL